MISWRFILFQILFFRFLHTNFLFNVNYFLIWNQENPLEKSQCVYTLNYNLRCFQTAGVPRTWATHGGEDVPVFAIGPLANILFSGSIDQSYIPHAIAYAACMGRHASRCSHDSATNNDTIIAAISCPSAEPNSAAISSDVMNDQARNPPSKSSNNGVVSGGSNSKCWCTDISSLSLLYLLLLISLSFSSVS